jgi:hypothetical protein
MISKARKILIAFQFEKQFLTGIRFRSRRGRKRDRFGMIDVADEPLKLSDHLSGIPIRIFGLIPAGRSMHRIDADQTAASLT